LCLVLVWEVGSVSKAINGLAPWALAPSLAAMVASWVLW